MILGSFLVRVRIVCTIVHGTSQTGECASVILLRNRVWYTSHEAWQIVGIVHDVYPQDTIVRKVFQVHSECVFAFLSQNFHITYSIYLIYLHVCVFVYVYAHTHSVYLFIHANAHTHSPFFSQCSAILVKAMS